MDSTPTPMLAEFGQVDIQIKPLRRLAGSKLGHHIARKILRGGQSADFFKWLLQGTPRMPTASVLIY
jgi:hypothetical protein